MKIIVTLTALSNEQVKFLSQLGQFRDDQAWEAHCDPEEFTDAVDLLKRAGVDDMLPEMFRAADTAAGRVYVRFAEPAPERVLCMAWSLLRYRTNAARAFAEAVRAQVARQSGNASRAAGRQGQD
jgi:hypothetical protein